MPLCRPASFNGIRSITFKALVISMGVLVLLFCLGSEELVRFCKLKIYSSTVGPKQGFDY